MNEEYSHGMFDDNIKNIVLDIMSNYTDESTITLDSHLQYDLGFDSLTMLEVCLEVENEFNVHIAENIKAAKTVGDIVVLIGKGNPKKHDILYNINDYPLPKTKRHTRRLKRLMWLSRFLWEFKVYGTENIPTNEQYILCPNHQSLYDSLWVWAAIGSKQVDLQKISCLAAEVFISMRDELTMLGGIPVERNGNTVPAMKRAQSCINDGYIMLIFPEGTRTRSGKIQKFKNGAAKLAIDANVPIIPVRIDGAWDIFPPQRKRPKIFRIGRRYPIKISFGKPINPDGKSVEELTAQLQSEVEQMSERK